MDGDGFPRVRRRPLSTPSSLLDTFAASEDISTTGISMVSKRPARKEYLALTNHTEHVQQAALAESLSTALCQQ